MKNLIRKINLALFAIGGLFTSTLALAHANHESHTHFSEVGLIAFVIVAVAYALYRLVRSKILLTVDNKIVIKSLMK